MKLGYSAGVNAIVALAFVVLPSSNLIPTAKADGTDEGHTRISASTYHDTWRKLWEDHITWTRMVIIGTFDDLTCLQAYKTRLLQNYEDMEAALKPYYGDGAEELGDLIKDHLLVAVQILNAAKNGDTAAQQRAINRWYQNGEQIATLMAKLNPKYWPRNESAMMWKDHLDATLAEAVAHLTNDCDGDVNAYDVVHDMALDMADFFSDGVIRQFPNQFSRRDSDGEREHRHHRSD